MRQHILAMGVYAYSVAIEGPLHLESILIFIVSFYCEIMVCAWTISAEPGSVDASNCLIFKWSG